VVSGLATGIDTEAHCGCLDGQGKTIAVLGCGLDVVYPRSNKTLYSQIAEQGVLVSEYALGTRPEGFRFPARNRIIAGLCHGVVVVEAARKSGSLITVQHALEEGREVFAVPGQIDSAKSNGTHWLLQQGASLAVSAADIIDSLGLGSNEPAIVGDGPGSVVELEAETAALFGLIDQYPIQRNVLVERSGMSPAKISEHLLLLELEGLIEILRGDQIRRVSE
jgi:DNA processing protein